MNESRLFLIELNFNGEVMVNVFASGNPYLMPRGKMANDFGILVAACEEIYPLLSEELNRLEED